MKTYYVLLITVIPFLSGHKVCEGTYWQVTGKSRVEISGTTNINDFHCLSVNYQGEDIMKESCSQSHSDSSLSGEIVMKSNGFDCHKSIMNKDFAKTVKANEFPEIGIRFMKLEKNPSDQEVLSGEVEITLAGKSNTYAVTCMIKEEGENTKQLEGYRLFRFSDFGLQAPRKLFGAIKVRDSITVAFNLELLKCKSCD